jgi:hypothetical protein
MGSLSVLDNENVSPATVSFDIEIGAVPLFEIATLLSAACPTPTSPKSTEPGEICRAPVPKTPAPQPALVATRQHANMQIMARNNCVDRLDLASPTSATFDWRSTLLVVITAEEVGEEKQTHLCDMNTS